MPGWYRRRNRGSYQPALEGAEPIAIFGAALKRAFDWRSATMTGATWTDQTGNADATQGTGGLQPAAGTAINGKATLSFDGTDDTMTAGAVPWTTTSGFTVYVVGRSGTLVAGGPSSGDCCWSESGGYAMGGLTTASAAAIFTSVYRTTTPSAGLGNNTVFAKRTSQDGGTSGNLVDRVSGFAAGSYTYGPAEALGSAAGNFLIGKNYTPATHPQWECAAIYVVNRVATAAENAAMDRWIQASFGVSGIT